MAPTSLRFCESGVSRSRRRGGAAARRWSTNPGAVTSLLIVLLSARAVKAERVCTETESGQVCRDSLSPGAIAAIVLTVTFVVLALLGAAGYFFYRRRKLDKAANAVAANAYIIDAQALQRAKSKTDQEKEKEGSAGVGASVGAPVGAWPIPTFAARPDSNSPSRGPGAAASPQRLGGVTFPFQGYSSPKGTPPRSESAFGGTYTTLTGMGSGGKRNNTPTILGGSGMVRSPNGSDIGVAV
ncbi:hypothetical protein MKEN_01463400 [Mycena kentingensis (nom. inval.)]|nr:hypothetical protein MKEN_01463400 [Mycena kentingensis (nom. inval.)]